MNKERRAEIESAIQNVDNAIAEIANAKDGEQDYFDNMPEGIQMSEKGSRAEEVIDLLSNAEDELNGIMDTLEDAKL